MQLAAPSVQAHNFHRIILLEREIRFSLQYRKYAIWLIADLGCSAASSEIGGDVIDKNGNNRYSDRWIEDSGYLRIQNIQLGYNLSQDLLSKWSNDMISNFRIYVGAQNLATFTKYSGYDPEVGRTQSYQKGEFTLATGQDGGASPLPRIIQLGLSVTFN